MAVKIHILQYFDFLLVEKYKFRRFVVKYETSEAILAQKFKRVQSQLFAYRINAQN